MTVARNYALRGCQRMCDSESQEDKCEDCVQHETLIHELGKMGGGTTHCQRKASFSN